MHMMRHWIISGLLILVFAGCVHQQAAPEPSQAIDESRSGRTLENPLDAVDETSTDIDQDIHLMWSVHEKQSGQAWVAATDEAILAASRVFNTLDVIGLSPDELTDILRLDLRSPDYGYYAPFWPIPKGVFPIRIDNGLYGWQFDLYFDAQDRVSKVEKRWIH